MEGEIQAIRQEILAIHERLGLIKETNDIRKEIESIQSAVNTLQHEAHSTPASSTPTTIEPTTAEPQKTPEPEKTPTPQKAPEPEPAKAEPQKIAPTKPAEAPKPAEIKPVETKPATSASSTAPTTSSTTPKPATTTSSTAPKPATTGSSSTATKPVASSSGPGKISSKELNSIVRAEQEMQKQQQEAQTAPKTEPGKDQPKATHSNPLEQEAADWIEAVTGENQPADLKFSHWLKSGTVLCNLVNKLKPGTIPKVNKMKMPFAHMENINGFIQACTVLSVPGSDLFMTVDLYEEKNLNQVITCIHSLGRASRRIPGYTGPNLGAKLADKHSVNFTDEQKKRGFNELTFAQNTMKDVQKDANAAKRQTDKIVK